MKLAPRERRPRPDYLVDHADELQLGAIFLRWGKKTYKKKKDTTAAKKANAVKLASKKKEAAAAAAPKASEKKKSPPTSVKKSPPTPVKKSAPTPAKAASSHSPSPSHAKASPAKKPATPPVTSHHRNTTTPATKKSAPADIRKPSLAATTLKKVGQPRKSVLAPVAPVKTIPAAVVQRTWSTHGRPPLSGRGLPPVIPNPVPTPALPACDVPDSTAQSPTITVTVRTMNNISFRIIALAETKLYELKRQIIDLIGAIGPAPQYCPQLPLLVMNGRALAPDHATLSALGFGTNSTVYCFPEVA